MTLAVAPTQTGDVFRAVVPACECPSCPEPTHGGFRGLPGGPVVDGAVVPVQPERVQQRRKTPRPRRLIATWTPSTYPCTCPSCEDTTHDGTLGTPAVWTEY